MDFFEKMCDFEYMLACYRKALRADKRSKGSLKFQSFATLFITRLIEKIKNGIYTPSPLNCFTVYEPKERLVTSSCFEDRIVHHAIVGILEDIYEKDFDPNSFSCRKGKGRDRAIGMAFKYLRKYDYYLKCDIRKYFYNIDIPLLVRKYRVKIKDEKFITLLEKILYNNADGKPVGLPIGILTSQFSANFYLDELDKFIRLLLPGAGYVRYMDDFIIFYNERAKLKGAIAEIENFLNNKLHLELKKQVTLLGSCYSSALSFLGLTMRRDRIRVKQDRRRRLLSHLKQVEYKYEHGIISQESASIAQEVLLFHLNEMISDKFLE